MKKLLLKEFLRTNGPSHFDTNPCFFTPNRHLNHFGPKSLESSRPIGSLQNVPPLLPFKNPAFRPYKSFVNSLGSPQHFVKQRSSFGSEHSERTSGGLQRLRFAVQRKHSFLRSGSTKQAWFGIQPNRLGLAIWDEANRPAATYFKAKNPMFTRTIDAKRCSQRGQKPFTGEHPV